MKYTVASFAALVIILMSFELQASGSVLINGKEVKSQVNLHELLAKELNFPRQYGKNSEALYDTLSTDYSGQIVIKFKSLSILKSKLGVEYTESLIQAIMDASNDNPKIVLLLE